VAGQRIEWGKADKADASGKEFKKALDASEIESIQPVPSPMAAKRIGPKASSEAYFLSVRASGGRSLDLEFPTAAARDEFTTTLTEWQRLVAAGVVPRASVAGQRPPRTPRSAPARFLRSLTSPASRSFTSPGSLASVSKSPVSVQSVSAAVSPPADELPAAAGDEHGREGEAAQVVFDLEIEEAEEQVPDLPNGAPPSRMARAKQANAQRAQVQPRLLFGRAGASGTAPATAPATARPVSRDETSDRKEHEEGLRASEESDLFRRLTMTRMDSFIAFPHLPQPEALPQADDDARVAHDLPQADDDARVAPPPPNPAPNKKRNDRLVQRVMSWGRTPAAAPTAAKADARVVL
jgi:hypothetical protein